VSLQILDASVSYGRREVVRGVALHVAPGEVLALLGPNGCGKSSLMRAVARAGPLAGGSCRLEGRVSYLPQDAPAALALTVLEVVLLGRLGRLSLRVAEEDTAAAAAALEEVGARALMGMTLAELSGGQRQLVFLAQALAGAPEVLLLDEPTSALDLRNQYQALALLRNVTRVRNIATLIVLHDLNAAVRFADRLALMHEGRVVAEGPAATVLTARRISDVFGLRVELLRSADGLPVVLPLGAV
jgi:iron complex transport system ATP-binding protein